MLQRHIRIALLFLLSSTTSWAFSPLSHHLKTIHSTTTAATTKTKTSFNGGLIYYKYKLHFAKFDNNNDDDDDFYSDYDPNHYESFNQQTLSTYDDYGDDTTTTTGGGRRNNRQFSRGRQGANYTRDISRDNSNIDEKVIVDLLSQRMQAKRNRDFDTADAIRDDLLQNYAVGVDDRSKTWRTGCSSSGSGMRFGGGGRGGRDRGRGRGRERDFGPNGHDYDISPDAGPNSSALADDKIHELLAERLQAKMSRNFNVADSIQIDLINSGVYVHDGLKEWRADGIPFGDFDGGRGPGRTRGSRSDFNRPYEKSIYSDEVIGCDDSTINKLVMERSKYKVNKDYEKADAIREGLRSKFNVIIDDKLKEWSVGGSFGEEHDKQREMAEKFANRGIIKSPASMAAQNEGDEEEIQALVDERTDFKADRNYVEADAIREDLFERFNVVINDKLKEWSIGGSFSVDSNKSRDYEQSPSSATLDEEDDAIVRDALRKRSILKARRDFDSADAIRNELREQYNVVIDDRAREWRVLDFNRNKEIEDNNDDDEFEESFEREMAQLEANLNNEISPLGGIDAEDIELFDEGTTPSEEELSSLTVVELKEKLRANGLAVSGKKSELVERLLAAM